MARFLKTLRNMCHALAYAAVVVLSLGSHIGPLAAQSMANGAGAELRILDRISGQVRDYSLSQGEQVTRQNLQVQLDECRYPKGQINAEAYAFLRIRDLRQDNNSFEGWMIASSPALSALEHPRYDVWILRCTQ